MANMLSPGVYVEEVDKSAIVPSVSANVAFLAGNFEEGPVDQPYVVTNKTEYEEKFGTPKDRNYNEWFQGYKFFDYANQLVVTRAFVDIVEDLDSPIDSPVELYTFTSAPVVVTNDVTVTIEEQYNYELHIGDYVSFGGIAQLGVVSEISYVDNGGGDIEYTITATMLSTPDIGFGSLSSGSIFLHSDSHKNGGTQAHSRGAYNETTGIPSVAYAGDPAYNVDILADSIVDGTENVIPNENRLNYTYELIKNPGDFDYKYDQNALQTFLSGMKLKFFTKDPNTSTIEIAIANSYDFITEGAANSNFAVGFREVRCSTVQDTYLTSLFEYAPLADQIAIAIKKDQEIETFIVSLDPISVDGNGKNNYIETVINENSKFVYVVDNTGINDIPATYLVCDRYGFQSDGETLAANGTATTVLTINGGRSPLVDVGSLRDAYFTVEDKERFEIDVIIGTEQSVNTASELAEARKDCIAYVGARYEDTVGKKAIDASNAIINYIKNSNVTRSMFGAFFGNYFRIYDKYNKKYRWINVAGDMAGIRCDVTSNTAPWWVSAGEKRGIIRNVNKLAFTPSQAQRDNLYKIGINPIVSFPGSGNLVWGNKTLHPIASSFDRINVRTLFNTLERAMAKAARSQTFEFNDPYTRNAIQSMFNPYLSTIKAGRGISDYLVVCDESNNTPDVISRNELRVDIYIKPMYAAEMILLTFTNVGTRSFSDVIGV